MDKELGRNGTGAVYIYKRDNGTWNLATKLTDSTLREPDERGQPIIGQFGQEIALQGDILVVSSTDRVFIYERNQGGENNWGQIQMLMGHFGVKAMGDNTLILISSGDVYIFERDPNTQLWDEVT